MNVADHSAGSQLFEHDGPTLRGQLEDGGHVLHGLFGLADDEVELELGQAVAKDQPDFLQEQRVRDRLVELHPQRVAPRLGRQGDRAISRRVERREHSLRDRGDPD